MDIGGSDMNNVVLMGRLTRNPDIRYSQAAEPLAIARYTLAVDRRMKREGEQSADFISCIAFGKAAEFAEKYLRQGIKICVKGRIQTGSYTNKVGVKVYTTDVIIESQEFAESKQNSEEQRERPAQTQGHDGFMNIPDGLEDELPFS